MILKSAQPAVEQHPHVPIQRVGADLFVMKQNYFIIKGVFFSFWSKIYRSNYPK